MLIALYKRCDGLPIIFVVLPTQKQVHRTSQPMVFHYSFEDRFNGFGYLMFLFVICAFVVAIIDGHGWPMCIFSGLFILTALELIYRLYARH